MKRSVIFLTVLTALLAVAIASEYFYSNNLKEITATVIEQNADQYEKCASELLEIMDSRKFANRMFYSKDTTERIISEIKKMGLYAKAEGTADAQAQLENVKFLYESLYRFNANHL